MLSGTIIFPFSSTAFMILQVARIDAMAIHRLLLATYCPVHILVMHIICQKVPERRAEETKPPTKTE